VLYAPLKDRELLAKGQVFEDEVGAVLGDSPKEGEAYSSPEVYRLLTDRCVPEAERDEFLGQMLGGIPGAG